jgi:hypothetical protein
VQTIFDEKNRNRKLKGDTITRMERAGQRRYLGRTSFMEAKRIQYYDSLGKTD